MTRTPEHPIDEEFPHRWSPRAMSGDAVSQDDLERLFEAARWAPSSNNNQPWRFLYARAGTPAFETFFNLLVPQNQVWCKQAGALLCIVSRNTFDNGSESRTHSFDTGAAWMSLALQGQKQNLVTHGMQGFDYDRARTDLHVPDGYTVECMVAIGHPGRKEDLPEKLQAREEPNNRHPIASFAFEGGFKR